MNEIFKFFFKPRFNINNSIFLFAFFAVISSMLIVPLKVTVDGWLYLSSARSLFTNDMSEYYYWIREPGYPLLLKTIHTLSGNADLGLIFTQSFILSLAIAVSIKSFSIIFEIKNLSLFYLGLIYILFLNPYILGFTGMVLQQTLFSLFLANSSLAFALLLKYHDFKKSFGLLTLTFLLAILTSIAFLVIFIPIFFVFFTTFIAILNQKSSSAILSKFRIFLAPLLVTSVMYFGGLQVLRFWDTFKKKTSEKSTLAIEQISLDQANSSLVSTLNFPRFFASIIQSFEMYRDNFLSLFHLRTSQAFPFYEISILVSHQFAPQWRCGFYDPFDIEPYASFGLGYFAGTCRSEFFHDFAGRYLNFAEVVYVLMMLFFIVFSILVLFTRKRYVFLLLIPQYSLLIAYSLSNAGIDRYGFPIVPTVFGMLIILNCGKIYQKIQILKPRS